MENKYEVTFKNGRKQFFIGKLFLFTEEDLGVTTLGNANYLNAKEVSYVIPQPSEKGGE